MFKKEELNPQQKKAVTHLGSPALVIAGAGSGKTKVITEKINFLVNDCSYTDKKIYAITFTNKAALEMKQRIKKKLKQSKINVHTFHTLGLKIIQQEYRALNIKKNFSIFDNEDSCKVLQDIVCQNSTLENQSAIKDILYKISMWKSEGLSPEDVPTKGEDALFQKIYEEYQKRLASYSAFDFDDLVLTPIQLLKNNEEIASKWRKKIQYLLVDEYQDTNITQYHFIQLLTAANNFTVVGDDQQSIYAWRGARPENIVQLQKDYPNLETIPLEQNYRSTNTILKAANSLIKFNTNLFDKNLWSDKGDGEKIKVIHANDDEHEADIVVSNIFNNQIKTNCRYSNYAILYRSNYQALKLEKALREYKIPYQITGGISFFSRTEIKDVLGYLKLIVNTDDDASFLRVINTPKRGIGPGTIEKLSKYAANRNKSLFDSIFEMGLSEYLDFKYIDKLRTFANWIISFAQELEDGSVAVIRKMLDDIDYKLYLEENSSSLDVANKRYENVTDLLEWIDRTMKKDESNFAKALNKILLTDILDKKQSEEANDAVQLLTLHAAKGLEFNDVTLIGFEEKLIPHQNSIESDDIEEERRIAYVGITRAKKNLTITLCLKRKKFKEQIDCKPSRFLEEIDSECLDKPDDKKLSEEEKKQKGIENMESILAMLQV